jgi:hypothetical protein
MANRMIGGRELKRTVDSFRKQHGVKAGGRLALAHLSEALEAGHLKPRDFSLPDLFEAFVPSGREWSRSTAKAGQSLSSLLEGGDGSSAVGYADFSNITGQIFFTEVKEKYSAEEFAFSKEITSKASTIQDIEKIPGIARIGDQEALINEGAEYPRLGVSEDYQEVSYKRKRGAIVEVTSEAVRGDRTGELLDRCGELGYFLDAVLDKNGGAVSAYLGGHQYTWKGTAYATYQSSTPWVNVKATNALVDETNVDSLWQIMAQITDPYTGEPILVQPDVLICSPDIAFQAHRLLLTTEFRRLQPGFATGSNPVEAVGGPALPKVVPGLRVLTSRLLRARMSTASETTTDWFLGNLKKAIHHYYIWDVTTAQRGTGTEAEFERDIVLQFKASLKDTVAVFEPRLLARSTAA